MNKKILSVFRKEINFLLMAALSLYLMQSLVSCDGMNDIHKKYYDMGEGIYTGALSALSIQYGFEKVHFMCLLNADPRITKTIIYWNLRQDSVEIPIVRTQSGSIVIERTLTLPEGNYSFQFVTRDDQGHSSLAREASVEILGNTYKQGLRNRSVISIEKLTTGDMQIKWDAIASKEIQYVALYYELNGQPQTTIVENSETVTVLTGLQTGDKLSVVTYFLPPYSMELFDAPARTFTMPKLERQINKANFQKVALSGDNTTVNGDRDLARIWDGVTANPNILHTVDNAAGFNFPHHFTFDMGVLAEISRFRIWPRTEAGAFSGHSPRFFEIWGSPDLKKGADDEAYWKSDDWKADWKLLGDCEIVKPVDTASQTAAWAAGWEFPANDSAGRVRYIRLIIKNSNWQNSNCVNIGEITLWGDDL
jgi:hypothetical protein